MSAEDAARPGDLPSMRIVRGAPSEDEIAAITGVLPLAYLEETESATADEPASRGAWTRSRRLRRLPGTRWGGFGG